MTKRDKKKPIEDATEILDRESGDDEELPSQVAEAKRNVRIAERM
jgi:hypothetical protein